MSKQFGIVETIQQLSPYDFLRVSFRPVELLRIYFYGYLRVIYLRMYLTHILFLFSITFKKSHGILKIILHDATKTVKLFSKSLSVGTICAFSTLIVIPAILAILSRNSRHLTCDKLFCLTVKTAESANGTKM